MTTNTNCGCCGGTNLVFACSGASDVGAVADEAARRLSKEGKGKMFCGMGIGGRVPGIMKTTEAADRILAIDGCPLNCTKKSLERAGFTKFEHLLLADLGMEKGKTDISTDNIARAAQAGEKKLVC
ncbi:MAG: putative zinc-binding protein [Planctomycetota bacterium]